MLFKPELLAKVLSGEKTQTRRARKDTHIFDGFRVVNLRDVTKRPITLWRIGQTYAACPGRGKVQQGRILIKSIDFQRLSEISEADARREGFANRDEFFAAWDTINGKGRRNERVWIIRFEVVK
jgi:hypothetical protein